MSSTACWSWDARTMSVLPDREWGWGHCGYAPDPCTTLPPASPSVGTGSYADIGSPFQTFGRHVYLTETAQRSLRDSAAAKTSAGDGTAGGIAHDAPSLRRWRR